MRRFLTSASLIASLALTGVAVAGAGAGPDGHRHGPGPGGPFMRELRDLDLSDAQKSQIRGFFGAVRDEARTSRDAMRELHRSYDQAVPGTPAFRTLTAQLADAEAAQARERVQKMADIRTQVYGVLTPDQRKQLAVELAKLPEFPADEDAPPPPQ
jgi:Spy/CpxP family protein refolding chaperone